MNKILWLITDSLIQFIGGISYFLISFFIWENGKSFETIVKFNLEIVLYLFVFYFAAYLVTFFLKVKFSFILSILARVLCLVIVYFQILNDSLKIQEVAILIAIYSGLSLLTRNLLNQQIVDSSDLVKFSAYASILRSSLSILSPLITAFLISTIGYKDSILISAIALTGFIPILLIINLKPTNRNLSLPFIFIRFLFNKNLRKIAIISFTLGITYSLSWGLIDILMLNQLNSTQNWGILKAIFTVITIIIALRLKNFKISTKNSPKGIIALSSLVFCLSAIYLLTTNSPIAFYIFILCNSIFSTVSGILIINHIVKMSLNFNDYSKKSISYNTYSDSFINIGQILPILGIFLFPDVLGLNNNGILLAILFITLVPLLTIGYLKD